MALIISFTHKACCLNLVNFETIFYYIRCREISYWVPCGAISSIMCFISRQKFWTKLQLYKKWAISSSCLWQTVHLSVSMTLYFNNLSFKMTEWVNSLYWKLGYFEIKVILFNLAKALMFFTLSDRITIDCTLIQNLTLFHPDNYIIGHAIFC